MSELCIIVAASRNGVIGRNGEIPWHIPEDFKFFKQTTQGSVTIMGRKTYESIGKALPGRPAIVVSTTLESLPDAEIARTYDDALQLAKAHNTPRIFIIGGEALYRHYLDIADTLYLTLVDRIVEGDATFPGVILGKFTWSRWHEVKRESHMGRCESLGGFNYHFYEFRRR